jgi:hypothetical protein
VTAEPVSVSNRWWAAVAGYPVLLCLGWGLASLAPRILADAPGLGTVVGLLASLCFAVATLVYVPLLPLALYRDGAALRESGAGWPPSPVRWGLAGLVHALAPFASPVTVLSLAVALGYLAVRHRRVGLP